MICTHLEAQLLHEILRITCNLYCIITVHTGEIVRIRDTLISYFHLLSLHFVKLNAPAASAFSRQVGLRRTGSGQLVAPVAQWIEQWFPEPCAQVRFLPGVLTKSYISHDPS